MQELVVSGRSSGSFDRVSADVLPDRVAAVVKIWGYDNSKPSAVIWPSHAWRHQFPNT